MIKIITYCVNFVFFFPVEFWVSSGLFCLLTALVFLVVMWDLIAFNFPAIFHISLHHRNESLFSFCVGAVSWWILSYMKIVNSLSQGTNTCWSIFSSDYENIFWKDLSVFTDDAFSEMMFYREYCFIENKSYLCFLTPKSIASNWAVREMPSPSHLHSVFPMQKIIFLARIYQETKQGRG